MVGEPIHVSTRAQLEPWNIQGRHAAAFAARQLRTQMVDRSNLVLGASPRHRSAVVERAPTALPFAFGLREFARLAASVPETKLPEHPVARAHVLVEQARQRRGIEPVASPDLDDIPDPWAGPMRVHQEATSLIRAAVQTIVDVIAPGTRPSGGFRRGS